MMSEDFVVDVLHYTLIQISDNILSDCCGVIEKIFKNLHLNEPVSMSKALCSVKLLLNMYNKIYLRSSDIDYLLPAEKILQGIKCLLRKNVFDNSVESELLSIISILCQIKITSKIPNFTELLAEFYEDVFSEISATSKQKDYNSGQTMLMLKMLGTLYSSEFCGKDLKAANLTESKRIFMMNSKRNVDDECLLFVLLALHDNQNIAMQTSLFLVPEFIKCFKSSAPMRYILTEVLKKSYHNHSKIFLVLCNFFSIDFFIDEMNFIEFLVGHVNYWELIQFGVVNRDFMIRKQAMYLFKKTIEVLNKKQKCSGEIIESMNLLRDSDENFNSHWDSDRRQELIKIYSDIIIILEYLNEEQVHIVKPIFELIEKVVEKIAGNDANNFSWILTIYGMVLIHESTEIMKWGIKSLLKVPQKIFLDEAAVEKTATLLSSTLNNINLYYNNGLEITEALGCFFENISQLKSGEFFFKIFIKQVCKLTWSPEALFFVTRSFSKLRELSFWGPDEIDEIRIFVSKAFRTHNKIIRNGIQCEILNATVALTHNNNLPLHSFILLLSQFSTSEIFRSDYPTWTNVNLYLETAYSKEEAEKTLSLFLNSPQHNEKSAALSITLFHRTYHDDFPSKIFSHLLASFKNSRQRPYCDAATLDRYLSVVRHIILECLVECDEYQKLISMLFDVFEDIINYIHSRIGELSSPKDFMSGKLYLEAFESLMKLLNRNNGGFNFENLFTRLLKSLETKLCSKPMISSVQSHFGMGLVKILYESCSHKLESVCLAGYLLQHLNDLLKKEEKVKDFHTVWGKMNSEFFEAKWVVLEKLILDCQIQVTSFKSEQQGNCIHPEDLVKKCVEGLDVGGYGALRAIVNVLARTLPQMKDLRELESIVDSVWNLILERRKTDDFKFCIESFVRMLFQEKLFSKGEDISHLLLKYVDLIFSDSSLVTVHALMKHTEKLQLSDNSMSVLCRIVGKGMLYGSVQKKDDKLTAQVCSHIQSCKNCPNNENLSSCQIRARAVVKLLSIRDKNGVSKRVLDILMNVENEITKKRTRYFGNSFVHRIKTRLMQAVLVLLDSLEKEEKNKIAHWLYLSLVKEAPQASVRHLQEWSLSLLYEFCSSCLILFRDSVQKTPKGWCSLITVSYLLAKASPCEIDEAIREILPFSMDQHFETRLYAEVVIMKLYSLAQELELREVLDKWRYVRDCVQKSITRAEGNAAKNYFKLENHFFLNGFNIRTHYSLQTIYYDLPRLTNVASDEWISPALYDSICISGNFDLALNLFNKDQFLQSIVNSEWLIGKSEEITMTTEIFENYQKKMIPMKPLIPGWSECPQRGNDSFEKEGLIVVASLIDRIPNLGGLARTCEVFGASELVINTTKWLEDKDFKSVSVTAEKWIRVKEVKAASLSEYIVEMKQNGFRVVGAEQAIHSQPLTRTKFPRRCLLLLGNEKTGIPPNIIPLLDVCVEIPQIGIIRSLNVHVTGALFLWEYAKQNLFSLRDD